MNILNNLSRLATLVGAFALCGSLAGCMADGDDYPADDTADVFYEDGDVGEASDAETQGAAAPVTEQLTEDGNEEGSSSPTDFVLTLSDPDPLPWSPGKEDAEKGPRVDR